jgi:sulfate transport system permease protein
VSAVSTAAELRPIQRDERSRLRRRRLVRGSLVAICVGYLGVLVLGPLVAIVWSATKEGFGTIAETLTLPDVTHALYLSTVITIQTVVVTATLGCVAAWVLVRHRFVGRRLLNALVELPLAVSPVTVGLAAVVLFGRGGWFEAWLAARGIEVIYALPSMVFVTVFICIPFVIRSVAPVLEELGTDEEDAARTLGASSIQTLVRVVLPNIRWGLLYGAALTTARAIGEIGAVLLVSGIVKGKTETATIYILTAYEERLDTQGNIVALVLAGVSIVLLIGIEMFKHRHVREVLG